MPAAHAPQAKICTGTQNLPILFAAGVGFFHSQDITQTNIHQSPPLILSQYCFAVCSTLLGPYS